MKQYHHCRICAMVLLLCGAAVLNMSCVFVPDEEKSATLSKNGMTLVWSDEFSSGSVPSVSDWSYEIWNAGYVNNEKQYYVQNADNAYVSDGTLKIKALKDSSGKWTSARIKTAGKHSWKYGYIEARMKMPEGNGVWPAFWMMPEDSAYGTWPRSGELDIMEYSPGTQGTKVYSTVHHSGSSANASADSYSSLGSRKISDAASAFHTYGLKWTSEYVEAYYDDVSLGTKYYNDGTGWVNWPYDQNFYVILNLAMGGNLGGTISSTLTSATYEIDYVRVYQ